MIPLATTSIDVLRGEPVNEYDEPYGDANDPSTWPAVATEIRAVIDHPTGNLDLGGGQQNVVNYHLTSDPVELQHTDRIFEPSTGRTFRIVWYLAYPEHVEAGLRDVEGEV